MFIKGSFLCIKKNKFSSRLSLSNYIDGIYVIKYIYLNSPLLFFLQKQFGLKLKKNKQNKNIRVSNYYKDFILLKSRNKYLFKFFLFVFKRKGLLNLFLNTNYYLYNTNKRKWDIHFDSF